MILLSVNPRFARLILRGDKTIELRRRAPRCSTDFWIALYATSPQRAMVGVVRATEVFEATPNDLWTAVKDGCGLDQNEYRSYYQGTTRAVGIRLSDPTPFVTPVPLEELRRTWGRFQPPQSFAYLSNEQVHTVWNHAGICSLRGTAV